MSEPAGVDGPIDIQALAAAMLGVNEDEEVEYEEEEEEDSGFEGHPAWQEILNQIPEEYRGNVIPTLQKWDSGVSRQFQKIHDSYAPLRQFEELDPEEVRDALGVYQALNDNPNATWEAIGRVYGLSPQQVAQSDDDEEDYDDLPASVRNRLNRIDTHDQVLEAVTGELLNRQVAEQEAQEDAELEDYLDDLREEYGDFDEDFVVGLIASGVDGEEAVQEFFGLVESIAEELGASNQQSAPNVMSSSGGIPNIGSVDPSRLSNKDTKDLVAEILRMSVNDY